MKIISLEGPDFSGKSTIGTALLMKLRKKGLVVERMELPSRMITGIFTELLRNSKDKVDPKVFSMVYAADHLHHYLSSRGANNADVIIIERSAVSFFVYQGLVLGADIEWLKELNKFNKFVPDRTFVVKVPVEELLRRARIRVGLNDEFEKEDFVRKVAEKYYNLPRWLVDEYNVEYVDFEDVEKTVDRIIGLAGL